jgi:PAS domain S-box-containing protein
MASSSASGATGPSGLATPSPGASGAETAELTELREQLREAHETIDAIRSGDIDSLVIGPPGQEQVYAVASADRTYRLIVNAMSEGTATVSPRGVILDANPRLCLMTGRNGTELTGAPALDLIPEACQTTFARLLDIGVGESAHGEVDLTGPGGTTIPVLLAVSAFDLDGMLLRCLVLTDLSVQRAAEGRLAQTHAILLEQAAFLERAQASLGLGWWIADPRPGGHITASPQACRISGLPAARYDGTTDRFWSAVHPDDLPILAAAVAAAQEGTAPFHVEHRIVRPDGQTRWVLQSAVAERDDTGATTRLLGICQDITERKQSEDEIRAAALYTRSLIEASLDPLVTIGPDGAITDLNAATERATGRGRAELLGTELSDYFTEPDRARAGYQQVFREESVRDYPLELRGGDGRTMPVLYNASVYRDPSGQVLGAVAATHDITAIKRAEAALRESEERLRAVFDNAPVGIVDLRLGDSGDPELTGEFARVNSYFCQLVGYTADELQSERIQELTHPDDLDAEHTDVQRLIAGELDSYTMEKRYLRKGGDIVWAEVTRTVVRDPVGKPLLVVGVVRDVTAQRRAEAEVRVLNADLEARVDQRTAELERSNHNLEAFTYSVSHDLRAPLRALSGFSEALLEEYGDHLEETGRGYAERVQAASERMGNLIDDLLLLSRVSRGDLNVQPVNLSQDAAAIAGELQTHEPDRRVRFAIQDDVCVAADRALIRSVVQNLIENAWKFTARTGDAVIEFGTTTADGDADVICCYVRDNGAGFDSAYVGKLFQPFQRLHLASDFPGTGIGLASVRRIIERHGGRTWAQGAVDHGATFYFTLPDVPAIAQ